MNEDKATRYHRLKRRADVLNSAAAGVFLLVLLVATIAVARPRLTRDVAGRSRPSRISVATGVFGLMALVTLVLVAWNPPAGLLVLPALIAWPAAIAPVPVTSPLHRAGRGQRPHQHAPRPAPGRPRRCR